MMTRTSNVEWIKARLSFVRILENTTPRQREIIRLFDQIEELSKADARYLHSLATAEKNEIQAAEALQRKAKKDKAIGYASRRARNHQMFLAAGMLCEAQIIDKATGMLLYDRKRLEGALQALRERLDATPADHQPSSGARRPKAAP